MDTTTSTKWGANASRVGKHTQETAFEEGRTPRSFKQGRNVMLACQGAGGVAGATIEAA